MVCEYRDKLIASVKHGEDTIPIYSCRKNGKCVFSEEQRIALDIPNLQSCNGQFTGSTMLPTVSMKEPVGDKLAEIFTECGISKPSCGPCQSWILQMNIWGVAGCKEHLDKIVNHLNETAAKTGWLSMTKVALKGYFTTQSLINEAVRRAEKTH